MTKISQEKPSRKHDRKLHNEVLKDTYCPPYILRVNKSRNI